MPPQNAPSTTSSSKYKATCSTGRIDESSITTLASPCQATILSPPTTLCTVVMLDAFSVALVVPLLNQYYKSAGVDSANQRELLSSLFSSSQIIGGISIGMLSDLGMLSRRHILLLSFLGSALSYALIIHGGIYRLICSRVIVGLVKQTMTVSTSLMTEYTDYTNRTVWMGRLGASITVAWIAGPSIGSILYKHVGEFAPTAVACGLFVFNSIIATVLLPREEWNDVTNSNNTMTEKNKDTSKEKELKMSSFVTNLKTCFSSKSLASVVTSLLLYGWLTRATSYANMASFYEEKYGIEPHIRGYIKSYQGILNLLVQSFLVKTLLSRLGGERNSICIAAFVLSWATLVEVHATFSLFVCLVSPIVVVSVQMISLSLRSLLTQVTPKESLGSVLAALDVMQNAASVTVPLYRTVVFKLLTRLKEDSDASMMGDPDPRVWLLSSCVHWGGFAGVVTLLLSRVKVTDRADFATDKKNQ